MAILFIFLFLFPIIVIGAAAMLGLLTMRLYFGEIISDDRNVVSMVVAVGIPVVGAFAVVVSQAKLFEELFGSFSQSVWMWALGAFVVGLIIGWGNCRRRA